MLKEKIDQYKEKMSGKLPDKAKQVMAQDGEAVAATIDGRELPSVGDRLLNFELPDQNGNATSLSGLTKEQSLVITFFRGDW